MIWVAETNRSVNIVSDHRLISLLTSGCLHLKVPSLNTVWHDVKAAYTKCHEHITKLLQDYQGCIHIVTNAWTSTNHCTFIAWTVHLEHESCMLAFLLDCVEVPKSYTGAALVQAFQKMLEGYRLEKKVRKSLHLLF